MRRLIPALLSCLIAFTLVPSQVTAGEDLSRCGAIHLRDRPPLGQTLNWDSEEHVKRHNLFLRTHPRVFARAVGADVHGNKVEVMLERNTKKRRRALRSECGATKPRILYFAEGTIEPA